MPSSAWRIRLVPSKVKGLVTTPMVRTPSSRAAWAMIGAAPVPVPPPIPAVMKHMCAPARWSMIASMFSSAAAAPISGLAPAPRPSVTFTPICTLCGAVEWRSACASVFPTTKSTPSRSLEIMLSTALPPAPPTPNTVIRGLRSPSVEGSVRVRVMMSSACFLRCPPGGGMRLAAPVVRGSHCLIPRV